MTTTYFRDHLKQTGPAMITKWEHYFDIYGRELAELQGRDVNFLEIGVFRGGSIPMWEGFFGRRSDLTFADIDPDCTRFATERSKVEIGDQSDPAFLAGLAADHGPFDLVVDDGGHKMDQQITSFQHLWPHVKTGGLYVVEDTHTSYWPGFGGGYREDSSFIEFAKKLVDQMHSWYTDQDEIFPLHQMAREVAAVRFYDSMVFIEKRTHTEPPTNLVARDGRVERSRAPLKMRNRRTVF
ncbi:MAG: class I SAM-dependent methyltransferase [Roseobacter sp.]